MTRVKVWMIRLNGRLIGRIESGYDGYRADYVGENSDGIEGMLSVGGVFGSFGEAEEALLARVREAA